jgi:cell division septum initiation protein DivIVA
MNCPNCSAEVSGGQLFCGRCGSKAKAETVEDIQSQIESMRRRLDEIVQAKTIEQRFLEVDTTERVANRLMNWGKLFGFFVLIPISVLLLALSLLVGKELKDLHDVAETTRKSIEPILQAARNEAESAKATATGALQTSQEVKSTAESAKQQLSGLKTEITKREAEVRGLDGEVQKSKAQLQALDTALKNQSTRVDAVAQQVKTLTKEKNVQDVRRAYPIYGERHVVADEYGRIDLSKKTAQGVYIFLALSLKREGKQILDEKKVGEVLASLRERKYEVFLRGMTLIASTGQAGASLVRFGEQSCLLGRLGTNPPCILYFRQAMQTTVFEIRNMIRSAQAVPDDRVKFVDPEKMQSLEKGIA